MSLIERIEECRNQNVLLYVPELEQTEGGPFLRFCEGTGDNLLQEDIDDGYVDYIDCEIYRAAFDGDPYFESVDGGMVLLKRYYAEMTAEEILRELMQEYRIRDAESVVCIPTSE